ncbi:unnamed protein product [Calypogeia fissa]
MFDSQVARSLVRSGAVAYSVGGPTTVPSGACLEDHNLLVSSFFRSFIIFLSGGSLSVEVVLGPPFWSSPLPERFDLFDPDRNRSTNYTQAADGITSPIYTKADPSHETTRRTALPRRGAREGVPTPSSPCGLVQFCPLSTAESGELARADSAVKSSRACNSARSHTCRHTSIPLPWNLYPRTRVSDFGPFGGPSPPQLLDFCARRAKG